MSVPLSQLGAYSKLSQHFSQQGHRINIAELFVEDSHRFSDFSAHFVSPSVEFLLDYSKNRVTKETMSLLFQLARDAQVELWRDRLFAGEVINTTEQRSVLHPALRNVSGHRVFKDHTGQAVDADVARVKAQMRDIAERVRSGKWTGYTGKRILHIVNIGIGGSDLGPVMACQALAPYADDIQVHFVSNVDGAHLGQVLKLVNPEQTLFIVASKTFTTQETLKNANSAKEWFLKSAKQSEHVAKHFVALSTNIAACEQFGIHPDNVLAFWDWVGGRYSLWSAIGLSIALYVGYDRFEEMLAGGEAMDVHFLQTPLEKNVPVIMALLGVWYTDFFGAETHAVLPYDQHLARFPAYLQQLDMESNGKHVTRDGTVVDYATGPVVWGEPGTNGQHAFYQLLHQGTRLVPADFIAPSQSHYPISNGEHHQILLANFMAQTEALMRGKSSEEVVSEGTISANVPHRTFQGNRPTNSILIKGKITPAVLGSLIALYEWKVFVQGIVWGINSFDQWGVELGKVLAKAILSDLQDPKGEAAHDGSTAGLIRTVKEWM